MRGPSRIPGPSLWRSALKLKAVRKACVNGGKPQSEITAVVEPTVPVTSSSSEIIYIDGEEFKNRLHEAVGAEIEAAVEAVVHEVLEAELEAVQDSVAEVRWVYEREAFVLTKRKKFKK